MLLLAYFAAITLCNYLFENLPMWHIGTVFFPPATLLVGGVLVLRDYVQRNYTAEIAVLALAAACVWTYFIASPALALASASAFAIGETLETVVYTWLKHRPFPQRVLVSVVLSAPLESSIFLWAVGHATLQNILVLSFAKMVCSILVCVGYSIKPFRRMS